MPYFKPESRYSVWSEILHEIREECSNKRWKHFVFKKCCPKFVLKGNYCFYKKYTRGDKSRKRIHVLVVWHIAGGDVNNIDKMLLKWPYLSHLDLFICWRYSTCILLYVLFHYTIYAYDLKQAVTGNKTKHRWNIVEMAAFWPSWYFPKTNRLYICHSL